MGDKPLLARVLRLKGIAALSLAIGLTSCTPPTNQATRPTAPSDRASSSTNANGALVVATNSVLCDLTKQIAANTVNLQCLIASGTDPHEYKSKPEDSKAIEQAKLILYGGYNFEPGLIKLIKATSNPAVKVAVDELAVPSPQTFESEGETEIDPHIWHSAENGIQMAKVISQNLTQLEPAQASVYAANTEKLTNELAQINSWIKSQINTIPASQRKLVTTHDAFGYYSKAYAIPVAGALQGISTEEKPTPSRVKTLVDEIEQASVPTIFAETTVNPALIEAVAKEANVKVADQNLFADGVGEPGSAGNTYQKMLEANTKAIVEGLGGRYAAFQMK